MLIITALSSPLRSQIMEKRGGKGKLRRFIKKYFIKSLYTRIRESQTLKKGGNPSFNYYETLNFWRQPIKSGRNRHRHCSNLHI